MKTAIYDQDANRGGVLCLGGYSSVDVDPEKVGLWFGDLQWVKDGAPYDVDEERALEILSQKEIQITLDLGLGDSVDLRPVLRLYEHERPLPDVKGSHHKVTRGTKLSENVKSARGFQFALWRSFCTLGCLRRELKLLGSVA